MKVLVTGGAGFIGSHIVDLLIDKDYDVVIVDNLSSGHKENINPKAKFYNCDITSIENLKKIFEAEKPSKVIHSAAQIQITKSINIPAHDANTNILGGLNILECCKNFNINKIIYLSTAAIYGNPEYNPLDEIHPIKPISPYGVSKRSLELYFYAYHKMYDLKFISFRLANVYGPRDFPESNRVISLFTQALLNTKQPLIIGDGKQGRDFVYVKDIANAAVIGLENVTEDNFFNIGTGKITPINELFLTIKRIISSDINPKYIKEREGEIREISLKADKAKEQLDWMAEYSLEQGLKETVEWFRKVVK
tara:strand:+ start:418 stop:1341 length:924 start_codon:yes stop_codon:yes gene_type:complete